jgi:plasmid rolling circle replication initiator protein Rep
MFSDATHAIAFGKQFAFQQRAKEIATKGFSKTQIPKARHKKPPAKDLDPVLNKILYAIEEQEEILHGLSIRIYHSARLATKLVKNNPKTAASTMRKVKSIQQEYVHVLRVKAGTKAYQKHVTLGLQDLKDVEKNLEGLKNCFWNKKETTATDDALIAQLETEKLFPVMDSQGKISFSKDPSFISGSVTSSEAFSTTSSTGFSVPISPAKEAPAVQMH